MFQLFTLFSSILVHLLNFHCTNWKSSLPAPCCAVLFLLFRKAIISVKMVLEEFVRRFLFLRISCQPYLIMSVTFSVMSAIVGWLTISAISALLVQHHEHLSVVLERSLKLSLESCLVPGAPSEAYGLRLLELDGHGTAGAHNLWILVMIDGLLHLDLGLILLLPGKRLRVLPQSSGCYSPW